MQFKLLTGTVALANLTYAQTADSKTAGQAFKNIIQFKDIPADQLIPSMQFMAASLGVECSFCHIQGKMDADDKPTKLTARKMIAMTFEINKANFDGRAAITCNSCHRGAHHPMNIPAVQESDVIAPASMDPASPPTPEAVLTRYVTALGGVEAIKTVTTRVMKGNIQAMGTQTPIEVVTKAPNLRISTTHSPTGDSVTAFDGAGGWMGGGTHPARSMSAAESSAASLDAEFYFPLRIKELYPALRVGLPEMIAGVSCDTLVGNSEGHPPIRLYFARDTGLLIRMVRYAETPLGRLPTQIDYADYRATNGVKTPFRWTLSRPSGRFSIQVAEIQANIAVDDTRFSKPPASPAQ
jgi:photosynthetic reaction center cytochrome c subunit